MRPLVDGAVAMGGRARPSRRAVLRFLAAGVPAAYLFAVMVTLLLGRFQLALDVQIRQCLPGHRIFVIDRARHDARRGEIIVFVADERAWLEPRGAALAKIVVGLPGDRVRVTAGTTDVNGVVVGYGLLLADKAHVAPASLEREVTVPPGHVWVMGATVDSYDSRYYGAVPLYAMRGIAFAVI
jgi:conjugal transfer pilin signal peptidase TrbI